MTKDALRAERLIAGYDGKAVVENLSLAVETGAVTALVGPNACGKSTLLKAMSRVLPVASGSMILDGQDIHRMPTKQVARRLGVLPQSPIAPDGITVGDLVWRGRYPHVRLGQRRSAADDEAMAAALVATGTEELIERRVDELSGGQRQRVWIALALAQETPTLLLDEPTTYLDVAHQIEVMDLLTDLNSEAGKTIVLVSHDLNQAAQYADRLVAMRDGAIVATGAPAEVLDEALVHKVFGLRAKVMPDPVHGTPHVYPLGRHTPLPKGQST